MTKSAAEPAAVIAHRKSCRADGVGLSHYILMDKDAAAESPQVIASRQSCRADGVGLSHYVLMDKEGLVDKEGDA